MQAQDQTAALTISPETYKKLRIQIEAELKRTEKTGTLALNAVCNDANWRVGWHINQQKGDSKAVIEKLSQDTGRDKNYFYRTAQFQKQWPSGLKDDIKALSFSKLIELLIISEAKVRKFYVAECLKNGWSRDKLRERIRKDWYTLTQNGQSLVDELQVDPHAYYVYKAFLDAVLDGDTLRVQIDVGFGIKIAQTVRLRGINCAELDSLPATNGRAQRAKDFVYERLKDVPFLTIKTQKTDIYGRYLADVFYTPIDGDGKTPRYLNRELLEAGLAAGME